jgi:hypothetical protein
MQRGINTATKSNRRRNKSFGSSYACAQFPANAYWRSPFAVGPLVEAVFVLMDLTA